MKNIVFFAVGAAAVAGGAYLALKYWLNSTKNITKVILTDTFCKDTIKNWIDSLDTYDVDSNCKFFVIKTDYSDLEKLNFSNEDKFKLANLKSEKLLSLVLTDKDHNNKCSTLYVCQNIDSTLIDLLQNKVTELNFKF